MEDTLPCISVQLQVDNHVLKQAVAGVFVCALQGGPLRWGWLDRVWRRVCGVSALAVIDWLWRCGWQNVFALIALAYESIY